MKIVECQQGTPEWSMARAGIPTASEFNRIITTEGKPSKQKTAYLYKLAGERITGIPEESYTNGNMQRGQLLEEEARQHYEFVYGEPVTKVGFCLTDNGLAGCSPDGLVGEKGGLEIKCPTLSTHVGYLLDGKLPTEYVLQVQGNLLVTGREWWGFYSHFPGMKPLILRVERNEELLAKLKTALDEFCAELETIVQKIK
jgi:predicted phage-related endonuclease